MWTVPAGAAMKRGIRAFNVTKNGGSSFFAPPNQMFRQLNILSQRLVPVLRLEDILSILPAPGPKLTYSLLKISAQGADFHVLQSAGEYVTRFCTIETEAQVGEKGAKAMGTDQNSWSLQRVYLERLGFEASTFACHEDVPGSLRFVPRDLPRIAKSDARCSYDLNMLFRNKRPGVC